MCGYDFREGQAKAAVAIPSRNGARRVNEGEVSRCTRRAAMSRTAARVRPGPSRTSLYQEITEELTPSVGAAPILCRRRDRQHLPGLGQ